MDHTSDARREPHSTRLSLRLAFLALWPFALLLIVCGFVIGSAL